MVNTALSPRQRNAARARKAFLESFPDDQSRREHFRNLGQKSAAGRFVLSEEEAQTLATAYELLRGIAEKARAKVDAIQPDESAA